MHGSKTIDQKYILIAERGRGSNGIVYEARDIVTRQPVAVKVLNTEAKDIRARARFGRETKILKRLSHPNILRILDSGITSDDVPYFVSPYLNGYTLEHLFQEGCVSYDAAISIATQMLSGLCAAHKKRIIHRDVKPNNIFLAVTRENPNHQVQILDFGISKILDERQTGLTAHGIAIGNSRYMPPEQAAGSHDMDERADIYAIGLIWYQLFTGKSPFNNVCNRFYNPFVPVHFLKPTKINAALPNEIEAVILRALQRKPSNRFANAMKMQESFNNAMQSKGNIELLEITNRKTDTTISRCLT